MFRLLFGLISVLGIASAAGTVMARNLVHAALFLIAFFFTIACQFVLLEAEFLAAIQVLVYIGAVAILLLFGIMLTRNIQGDETTAGRWTSKLPAGIAALAFLATLVAGIVARTSHVPGRPAWMSVESRPAVGSVADPSGRLATIENMSRPVGVEMMTRYVIAFEVAGLLLTAAVVGAIALAQGDKQGVEPVPVDGTTLLDQRLAAIEPGPAPNGSTTSPPPAPAASLSR